MSHKLLIQIDRYTEKSLYHNRTVVVTEAYALKGLFDINVLRNSNLICGMSFC
jgi:hypothetical protein